MKRMFLALTALLWALPSYAQQVEVVTHGIYTSDETSSETMSNGIGLAHVTNVRLALSTDTIPAKQHVKFGFQYHVTGLADGTLIELRKVTRYPPPGPKPPSAAEPILSYDRTVRCIAGRLCSVIYGLDDRWEILPGMWTFELWNGDQKLAEQSFKVIAQ